MRYAFVNGTILDGTEDMQPVRGKAVLTDGDKIVDITGDVAALEGCEIIDMKGAYLLPGLIDLHVHLALSGKPPKPKKDEKPVDYEKLYRLLTGNRLVRMAAKKLVASYAKTEVMSGVTTIRTVGGVLDFEGLSIVENGGRKISKTGPDLIKLMITGGVRDSDAEGMPGVVKMQPEIVKAACDEAHRLGYAVAAHVESTEGVRVALGNGVDTIEHGAKLTDELIELFRERKAADICTLSPAIPYAMFTLEESRATQTAKNNGRIVLDGIIECAKACIENGIPVGLGSDVSCPFTTSGGSCASSAGT